MDPLSPLDRFSCCQMDIKVSTSAYLNLSLSMSVSNSQVLGGQLFVKYFSSCSPEMQEFYSLRVLCSWSFMNWRGEAEERKQFALIQNKTSLLACIQSSTARLRSYFQGSWVGGRLHAPLDLGEWYRKEANEKNGSSHTILLPPLHLLPISLTKCSCSCLL